jgi:hypothetical protein
MASKRHETQALAVSDQLRGCVAGVELMRPEQVG